MTARIDRKDADGLDEQVGVVHFTVPKGLTVRSAQGAGWDCSSDRGVVDDCYTEAELLPGQSLSLITLHTAVPEPVTTEIDYSVYGF